MYDDEDFSGKIGPVGAKPFEGDIWEEEKLGDENFYQLIITYGENYITSMHFKYKGYIDSVHGQTRADVHSLAMITLEKKEYIIGLSGTYNSEHLTSLTFETNRRKYGPYGNAGSSTASLLPQLRITPFSFQFGPGNHFSGLHGVFRNNKLSAIGVYLDNDD